MFVRRPLLGRYLTVEAHRVGAQTQLALAEAAVYAKGVRCSAAVHVRTLKIPRAASGGSGALGLCSEASCLVFRRRQ